MPVSAPHLSFLNRNTLWCSALVETLVRKGLAAAVVSPGSRSTPLTMAFAAHPEVEAIPVLDERSASFFALGLAKRSRRPVALVCTSGTAAANYLPAIVEAREAGVPLLVFTADRPPEMRACASGQTIDQQKLYGSYPVAFLELCVPEPTATRLRYLRQTIAHAYELALGPVCGPVHLNCPFRDPLHPAPEEGVDKLRAELSAESFWEHLRGSLVAKEPALAAWPLPATAKGLLVAGPSADFSAAYVEKVTALARKLAWPVLADALSPLRHQNAQAPALVAHYDTLLRSQLLADQLKPEAVVVLDSLPTSKVLRGWLESIRGLRTLHVSALTENRDPLHGASQQLRASLDSLLECAPLAPEAGSAWSARWSAAEKAVELHLDKVFSGTEDLFEPKIAWLLSKRLPAGTPLFVANSMPVRDLEYVWRKGGLKTEVYFNRGANGIDGTLSTALGVTHKGRPGVLLTGDLSLLHDTNGFLLRPRYKGSLTIVLVNNAGGGIFEHLPVAGFNPPFEEYFATPQQASFPDLARAYGVSHEIVADWERFSELVAELPPKGIRILELRTDRKADAARRKQLFLETAKLAENADL